MKKLILLTFLVCLTASSAFADMMKDSPVKFPEKGARPAKYPPAVTTKREVPEQDCSIFGTPQPQRPSGAAGFGFDVRGRTR
jgi:hypothetical protein